MNVSTFPRIEHVPGSHADRGDLVADRETVERFFRTKVWVFEKLDGINVSLTHQARGKLDVGLKPAWRRALGGRLFDCIDIWARLEADRLRSAVRPGNTLFGEWLLHRVHVGYRDLPAPFVAFALWDARARRFVPYPALQTHCEAAGLSVVTPRAAGRMTCAAARAAAGGSAYAPRRMEGLIFERDVPVAETRWLKWVDPSYRHPKAGRLSGALNQIRPEP